MEWRFGLLPPDKEMPKRVTRIRSAHRESFKYLCLKAFKVLKRSKTAPLTPTQEQQVRQEP